MSAVASTAMRLAEIAFERGDHGGAIEHLRDVLTELPEYAPAHAQLALALLSSGRLTAARHEAGQAVALDPESFFAHSVAASVALTERRFDDAGAHAGQAAELAPTDPRPLMIQAYILRARRRPREAMAAVDQALALDPMETEALTAKAWIALELDDVETAGAIATGLLAENPENVDALTLIGRLHLRDGDAEEARGHALWALQIAPHDTDALALLAAVKMRANPLTGLWWRYNAWLARRGPTGSILIMLGAFVAYRFGVEALTDFGLGAYATGLTLLWLLLCIYTWSGGAIMNRMIARELEQVRLKPTF